MLWIVHNSKILYRYDPKDLFGTKDHLLLPILVSHQILVEEEDEEIQEIIIGQNNYKDSVRRLKLFLHPEGQFTVVMTGTLSENEAFGAVAYKIIDLLCGPRWNALDTLKDTLTKCLDCLMRSKPSLALGFSGPPLTISNFPTSRISSVQLPPKSWIMVVKGSSVSYPMHGPSELPNLDLSFMVLLSQTLLPQEIFLKGCAEQQQCNDLYYQVYTFRSIHLPEHTLDMIVLRKVEYQRTILFNKLFTIRQVLRLKRDIRPKILQLCQRETFKLSQDIGRQMQCLTTTAAVKAPTIFLIDRLLVKMQFSEHDCPKSTLRKIGRDCAFLKVKEETVSRQCLRRLTIPLKCHANAKAWVLVNDRTKVIWARTARKESTVCRRPEDDDEKYTSTLLEAISKVSGKQNFPLRHHSNLIYKYDIPDGSNWKRLNHLTLYMLVDFQ